MRTARPGEEREAMGERGLRYFERHFERALLLARHMSVLIPRFRRPRTR